MMLINMRQSSELPSGGSGVYYSLPTLERDGSLRRLVVEGPL